MVALAAAVVFHALLAVVLWRSLDRPSPEQPKAIEVALLAEPADEASSPETLPPKESPPAPPPETSSTEPPPEEIPPPVPSETLASAEPPLPEMAAPLVDPPPPAAAPASQSLPPPSAKPRHHRHVALARRPQHHADAAPPSEPERPSEPAPPPAAHGPSAGGVAVYTVIVDAAGHIRDIVVALSSGEASLDEAGKGIIRENMAAEPPAPSRGGGDGVFTVTLRFSSDPH